MSFSYNLHVEEKDFPLLALEYYLVQKYQENGKPSGGVQGGRIRILLEIQDDTFMNSWMFDYKATHDGTITMYRIDEASKYKEIKFTKAYMVGLAESFSVGTDPALLDASSFPTQYEVYQWITSQQEKLKKSFVMYCEFSAETIKVDGVSHDNKWSLLKV